MKQELSKKHRLTMALIVVIGVVGGMAGCVGPNGINIGVFGGSRGVGMGVGLGFPIGESSSEKGLVQMQQPVGAFKVGEVVAQNDLYYRRFLGLTEHNGFVVQDFYKTAGGVFEENKLAYGARLDGEFSDKKLTNAYVLLWIKDVNGPMLPHDVSLQGALNRNVKEWLKEQGIEGELVMWFASGQKALSSNFKNGQLHGQWAQWYENGNRHVLGVYVQGEMSGHWKFWGEDGKLIFENDYGTLDQNLPALP